MTPPSPPSIHVRAFLTWCAIFPLVTIGSLALEPIAGGWHPVVRTFVLTAVVVPLAVYVVVPRLLRLNGVWGHRRLSQSRSSEPRDRDAP